MQAELELLRAQVRAVRDEHVEYERACEGYHEVVHPALEGRAVLYEDGYAGHGEEGIPHHVEHSEAGNEGNERVYGQIRDPVAARGREFLYDEEGCYIYGEVEHKQAVLMAAHKVYGGAVCFADYKDHSSWGYAFPAAYGIVSISTERQR